MILIDYYHLNDSISRENLAKFKHQDGAASMKKTKAIGIDKPN
jgi:hypothetical protein